MWEETIKPLDDYSINTADNYKDEFFFSKITALNFAICDEERLHNKINSILRNCKNQ